MKKIKITFWRSFLIVLWAFGLYAIFVRLTQGLGATTYLSDQFPWGAWTGFKLAAVALAAGGFTLTAAVYVFNLKEFKPILRSTVLTAYLGYLMFITALILDLGLPHHIWHPIIYWNHHSVMFEVAWCVILYTIVLTVEFLPLVFEKFKLSKPLKIINRFMIVFVVAGVLLSTLHQSSLGTLYVIVPGKLHPLWYSGLIPVLFFISAIAAGMAVIIFESYMSARAFGRQLQSALLEKLAHALVFVLLLLLTVRLEILYANNALKYIFDGSMESYLFLAEVGLGVIIPMIMLSFSKIRNNTAGLYLSAILVILGLVMNRFNVTVTGMAASSGVNYFPSLMEIIISLTIVSVAFVAFRLAAQYLPLFSEPVSIHDKPAYSPLVASGVAGRRVITVFGILFVITFLGMTYSYAKKDSKENIIEQVENPLKLEISDLKLPAPVHFEKSDDSPGTVIFDHESHVDYDNPNCVQCHAGMFKIRPEKAGALGTVNMELLYEGEQCGKCHNGTDAFSIDDGCEFCHQEN